jgi:hypothetical protein
MEEQQNKSTMMRNGKLALKGLTKEEKDKIKGRQERRTARKTKTKKTIRKQNKPKQAKRRNQNQNLNT